MNLLTFKRKVFGIRSSLRFRSFSKIFLATLMNNASALLITLVATKILTTENFGVFALYITIIVIGSLALNFGFNYSVVKLYKQGRDESLILNSIIWNILQGVFLLLFAKPIYNVLLIFLPVLDGRKEDIYILLVAIVFLNMWTTIRACDQAKQDFNAYAKNTILYSVVRCVTLVVTLFIFDSTINSFIFSLYIIPLILIVTYNIAKITFLHVKKLSFRSLTVSIIKLIGYGKWIVISSLAYLFISRLPQFFLADEELKDQLALYGVSLTFLGVILLFNDSIRAMLLPELIGIKSFNEIIKYKKNLISKFPIYLLSCLLIIASLALFQYMFLDAEYKEAIVLFVVQSIGLMITMYLGYFNVLVHRINIPHLDTINNILKLFVLYFALQYVPQTALSYSLTFSLILIVGEAFTVLIVNSKIAIKFNEL